jgi:hypothetical protein
MAWKVSRRRSDVRCHGSRYRIVLESHRHERDRATRTHSGARVSFFIIFLTMSIGSRGSSRWSRGCG